MDDVTEVKIDAAQKALWHTANLARAAAAYASARMDESGPFEGEITLVVLEDLLKTIERDAVAVAEDLGRHAPLNF